MSEMEQGGMQQNAPQYKERVKVAKSYRSFTK